MREYSDPVRLPMTTPPDDRFGMGPRLYCLWAAIAIGVSFALAGLTAETITRLS